MDSMKLITYKLIAKIYGILFYKKKFKDDVEYIRTHKTDSKKTIERYYAMEKKIKTPFLSLAFDQAFIAYEKDVIKTDEWESPIIAIKNGNSDCEEKACRHYVCLDFQGLTPLIYCCYTKDNGHATCIWRKKEVWYSIGTFGINKHGESYESVGKFFYDDELLEYSVCQSPTVKTEGLLKQV